MIGSRPNSYRDDRAWPRGAAPASALMGSVALGGGVLVAMNHRYPVIAALALVAGTALAGSLMLVGARLWFKGVDVFELLAIPAGVAGGIGATLFLIFDRMLGLEFALGLLCGCMAVNFWAVLKARRIRLSSPLDIAS